MRPETSAPRLAQGDETSRLNGMRLYVAVAVCVLIAMLDGFDVQAIGIAAPVLFPELKLDPIHAGQIFSSAQVGFVAGALLGGALSDLLGRRNALMSGVICVGAFSLGTIYTFSFDTLLAARLFTGLGIGVVVVNLISLTVEIAPTKHRAKIVAITLAGLPAGGAIAALVGHAFIESSGWRSLFLVGGLAPLLIAPFLLLIPNMRPHRQKQDGVGKEWLHALFGEGRGISTMLLWLTLFLGSCILYLILNWLPSLMTGRGFTVEFAHRSSAFFSIGGCVGTLAIGAAVDRFGYRSVLPLGYGGVAIGVVGLAFAAAPASILTFAAVAGFFILGSGYSLNGLAPAYYPTAARGLGIGASVAVGRAGSIVGPLLGGYILSGGIASLPSGAVGVLIVTVPLAIASGAIAYLLTLRARML